MINIPYFEVDAFTSVVFRGNPAGVCLLADDRLPDAVLQAIAMENRFSETAYLLGGDGVYGLRWFTPAFEVDLCGHATLASAHVLLAGPECARDEVAFDTRSGRLLVSRSDDGRLVMDLPRWPVRPCAPPDGLVEALGARPREMHDGHYLMAVFDTEAEIRAIAPDFRALVRSVPLGVIVTAPGDDVDVDVVSRFFAPNAGVDEDPVTGSTHCMLAPYWAERLGRDRLHARQVSSRGGDVGCAVRGDRCEISGAATTYLVGEITVPGEVNGDQ